MVEIQNKMGPHDMGGEDAGAIDIVDRGMAHWEKHANALRMTATGNKIATLDEFRRACEDLGDKYYQLGYFERLTEALVIILKEKEFFTDEILGDQMQVVRDRFDVPIIPLPVEHDHDVKPIQEEEQGEGPNEHHIMNLAVQDLLVAGNLITANDIRAKIEKFDVDYPNRGTQVVLRAWTDEKFKTELLTDANPAIESMGIDLEHAARLIVVENTDQVHNIVVCTLCSCYPRVLMGQPPTWYKSRSYRSRVVKDPRGVLREFGTHVDDAVVVRTHDSNADMRYMVLPQRPAGTEGWDLPKLESIISRDALVGVSIPSIEVNV